MTYKHIAIIALVLMLAFVAPVSAVWSNGNWIDEEHSDQYFGNAKVVTDNVTGVTSKYKTPVDIDLMTYQGMIVGHLKSGQVLEGGERFLIHRVGTPDNETLVQYFQPDGKYTGYLAPGEYDVILPQGTGSAAGIYSDDWGYVGNLHEERAKINVVVGQISYFDFIGNSVPSGGDDVCKQKITIKQVAYCGETESHIVHHAAIQAVPAYYTVAQASSHQECSWWWKGHCYDWDTVYDGDCDKVYGGGYYDFKVGGQKYKLVNHGKYQSTYHEYVPEVPAWDKTVIDHQGGCAYPVAELQSVVDRGFTSFLFDNRPAEGGIFSGSTLLAQISDPASGIKKHVSITYNAGCGTSDKTIEAMEYGVINL